MGVKKTKTELKANVHVFYTESAADDTMDMRLSNWGNEKTESRFCGEQVEVDFSRYIWWVRQS